MTRLTAVHLIIRAAALSSLGYCAVVAASVGVYGHGDGMQSMGMGGVSYSIASETTALAGNPAHAGSLGHRLDIGIELLTPLSRVNVTDNDLGPDSEHESSGKRFYAIPQGGYSRPLTDRISFGFSLLSAGLGPQYRQSPYERFGGASRSNIALASAGTITALSYDVTPTQTIGFGINLGYQQFEAQGLEFLQPLSESPDNVTDQGVDGAFSAGFTVGWVGDIGPALHGGFAYRSKSWTEKHDNYAGLIPEGGRLELPAIFGGGVTYTGLPDLTLSVEAQRYLYESEKALGARAAQLAAGNAVGSANGPGFGFKNQNVYKFGAAWAAHKHLTLRAGMLLASQMMRASDTFFGVLGPVSATDLYSVGATFWADKWELTSLLWYNPRDGVQGENSLSPELGGGEVSVSNELLGFGVSLGWRFGE